MEGKIKTIGPCYHKLVIFDFHFSLLQKHAQCFVTFIRSAGSAYKHPVMVRTAVSMEITQYLFIKDTLFSAPC